MTYQMTIPLLLIVLTACKKDDQPGPLQGKISTLNSNLPLAQGPSAAHARARRSISLQDGCTDAAEERGKAGAHYVALGPMYDDDIRRLGQVLRFDENGCTVIATLDKDASRHLSTGFTGDIYGQTLQQGSGLLLQTVETRSELWLFTNTRRFMWRIDLATLELTQDVGVDAYVVGALPDGAGGAWLTTLGELGNNSGKEREPPKLWHVDDTLSPVGNPVPLPWDATIVGFSADDESGAAVSRFIFHPIAIDGNGDKWVLDTTSATLANLDTNQQFTLDVVYPTGLAAHNGTLYVTSGIHYTPDKSTFFQLPALHSFDPSTGDLTMVSELPEVEAGAWSAAGGFVAGPPTFAPEGEVPLSAWFPLTLAGTDLLLSDPAYGRVLLIE